MLVWLCIPILEQSKQYKAKRFFEQGDFLTVPKCYSRTSVGVAHAFTYEADSLKKPLQWGKSTR
jgi:hypothetical protein